MDKYNPSNKIDPALDFYMNFILILEVLAFSYPLPERTEIAVH